MVLHVYAQVPPHPGACSLIKLKDEVKDNIKVYETCPDRYTF